MNTQSISHVLAHHAATIGEQVAYYYIAPRATTPLTLTYQQLYERTCMLAGTLQQYDLQGKNVLLMFPTGLEFIEAFYSCMHANVSAIPMYIPPGNLPDTRLQAVASIIEVAMVLTVKSREAQVRSQIAELFPDGSCQVVCIDAISLNKSLSIDLNIDLEQPPLIQFTSGSTSNPKGVVVTHKNLVANQYMMDRGFGSHAGLSGGETMVSWLPFFHDMGLICGLMYPIFIGGSAVLMSPTDFLHNPHKWLQLISIYGATISGAPNFAYDYCVRRIQDKQLDGLDLSSWKVAFNGSEMIRPETIKRSI